MGISHLTKKLALPLLFLAATTVSILLPVWKVNASGTGENYYQSDSTTIVGFGGSYSDTNYLYTAVQAGTTQSKQAIGNLTFTKDSSGKYTSTKVDAMRTSGTQQIACTMTLSISLNGNSGTISANPDPATTADAKTCLDLSGVATSITVATFNDQASCEKAGGSWSSNSEANGHMSNNGQGTCSNITAAGAQCAASGQTYTYQGEGNGHASNGPNWVCVGTATQQTVATQYKDQSSCETAGFTWDKNTNQCSDQPPATCDSKWYNPLSSLILCPIFNGMSSLSDWLLNNAIKPILQVKPVSTDTNNAIYKVWSNFRIYANVILIIVLLVIVFGQVIGGGVMDAYSVRKALPRVLAAAVLINLSIYIVNLLVDVTNVLGGGLMSLMEAPLQGAGAFHFMLSGGQQATGATFAGAALAGGVGGTILAVLGGTEILTAAAAWIGLFMLLPVVLGLLAAFVTIMLRLTLIVALILIAPVAFALWCLPNTEKYFKKWWDLLLNMLMAYPIIVAIFAVCDIISVIMINPQTNPTSNPASTSVTTVIAFVLQFLPLFLIPFAFKLAGGAIGSLSGFLMNQGKRGTETVKGNANDPTSLRNRARFNLRSSANVARVRGYDKMRTWNKNNAGPGGSVFARRASRAGGKLFGMGNIEATRSELNSEQEKIISAQYGNGDDTNIRALWAEKEVVNGKETGRWLGVGGKEFTQIDVDKAKKIVGHDPSRLQAYAKYEMGKVANDEQLQDFKGKFIRKANQFHLTAGDANGIWAGVKFAHQATRLEQKSTAISGERGDLGWDTKLPEYVQDRSGADRKVEFRDVNHQTYSEELVDRMRSYDRVSLRPSAAKAALEGYRYNKQLINSGSLSGDDLTKAQSIVDNYTLAAQDVRTSLRQGISFQNDDTDTTPSRTASGSTGGSPRADVVWKEFADEVLGSGGQGGASNGNSNSQPPSSGPSPSAPGGSPTPSGGSPSGGNQGPRPSGIAPSGGPRQTNLPGTAPRTPSGGPQVVPPSTVIRPTEPSTSTDGPIDLPPRFNPLNPPQNPPGTGPADIPDWMRNDRGDNPPPTT